jgi:hypothetical protein
MLSFRARLTHRPDDGGSMHLWNVGQHQLGLHGAASKKTLNFILFSLSDYKTSRNNDGKIWNIT